MLASAALHPLWNALVKRDPNPESAYLGLMATMAVLALAHGLAAGSPMIPPADLWPLVAVSAAGQTVYGVALVAVLRRGELSACYPIVRASPVAIVLYGWLVEGTTYAWPMLLGIALVLLGGWRLQAAPGRRLGDPAALGLAVLAMLGVAVYSVADGRLMQAMPAEALVFWVQALTLVPVALGFRLLGARLGLPGPGGVRIAFLAGALAYASYYLILLAYALGAAVAAVAAVRQASIPFSVLLGGLWLGERNLGGRLGASVVMAGGIVLIVLNR